MITTARDAVDTLGDHWVPEKVGDRNFVVQFNLTDPLPGDIDRIHVVFDGGVPTVKEGAHEAPDLTAQMRATDFVAMTNDQYNMVLGHTRGEVRIAGKTGYGCLLNKSRRNPG
jgi:putative sterol carrier protein